jgi:hypothetical protein
MRSKAASSFKWILPLLLVVPLAGVAVSGQSGRKLPTWNEPKTKPTPEAEDTSTAPKPKQKKPPTRVILVKSLINLNMVFWSDVVMQACLARLKQSPALEPSKGQDLNRKEAIDLAKSEKEAYVVLIELEEPPMVHTNPGDYANMEVQYIILTPGTGKNKNMGRVYPDSVSGPVGGSRGPIQYRMELAGREVANRIMSSVGVGAPGTRIP